MKIIKFAVPRGECYIPAHVVAEDRTRYYANIDGYEEGSKEWQDEYNYTINDEYECIDWMANNMNFEDFKEHIVMLNDKVLVTDEDGWENSDKVMDEIDVPDENLTESVKSLDKFGMMQSVIPEECPICSEQLKIIENKDSGSIGLYCKNDLCSGAAVRKLQKGIEQLDIKGIGLSTCEKLFEADIKRIEDIFDKTKFNRMKLIDSGHFKSGRSLDIIVDAVDKTNSLELKRIVNSLNITDVGSSVSEQIARMLAGLSTDFSGLNKAAVAVMQDVNSEERIRLDRFIEIIRNNNIDIVEPKELSSDIIKYEMTGNPPSWIGKKKDFSLAIEAHGYVHHRLNKDCDMLITSDIESTTGKMKKVKD
jgi:NAD-dependent DNA ligase